MQRRPRSGTKGVRGPQEAREKPVGEQETRAKEERDGAGSCKHAVVSHGGKYKREVGALKHSNDKQQGVAFPSATVVRASANGVCAAAPLMSDRRTSVCPPGPPPGNGCRRPDPRKHRQIRLSPFQIFGFCPRLLSRFHRGNEKAFNPLSRELTFFTRIDPRKLSELWNDLLFSNGSLLNL